MTRTPHPHALHPAAALRAHDPHRDGAYHDDIIYPSPAPFLLVHVACLAAFWTGVPRWAVWTCLALYVVRMFGVTAGYHRYFSHRTFRTGRAFQFVLALLAQSSAQRGVLWWAATHRHHHLHADTELDVHSVRHRGFWYAHWGWVFAPREPVETYHEEVPDLARFPELRWLDRWRYAPAAALAVACLALGGWAGLVVGFFWSTVLVYHGTFLINSLAHVHGRARYVTGDDSRNNWWLALLTLGEGWHNNHHAYQRSTRQGFRWYEVDATYYALRVLAWAGVVRDLGEPPADLVRNERPLGRKVLERVARQVAASFPAAPALPHAPTLDEVRARARAMLAHTPSLDDVAARARELLAERAGAGTLAHG